MKSLEELGFVYKGLKYMNTFWAHIYKTKFDELLVIFEDGSVALNDRTIVTQELWEVINAEMKKRGWWE